MIENHNRPSHDHPSIDSRTSELVIRCQAANSRRSQRMPFILTAVVVTLTMLVTAGERIYADAPRFMSQQIINNTGEVVDHLDLVTQGNVIKRIRYTTPGSNGVTTDHSNTILHIGNVEPILKSSASFDVPQLDNGGTPTISWERGHVHFNSAAYINKDNTKTYWSASFLPQRQGSILVGKPGKIKSLPTLTESEEFAVEFEGDEEDDLLYTNINVWAQSDLSRFTLEDFDTTSGASLIYSASQLSVAAGTTGDLLLGSLSENQYILIRADVARESNPGLYLATASATLIPEPSSLLIVGVGIVMACRRRRAGDGIGRRQREQLASTLTHAIQSAIASH